MAFSKKEWLQRIVQYPARRRMAETGTTNVYDISRAEGTVVQEGDGFTAANMNGLEQRIGDAFDGVQDNIGDLSTLTTTAKGSTVAAINEVNNNLTQYYIVSQSKISVQANTVITLSNLAAHESLAGKNIIGVLPKRITAYSSDDFVPSMWYDDNSRIVRFSTTVSQDYSFEFIVVYR